MKNMKVITLVCLAIATLNCGSSLPQVRQSLESNKKIYIVDESPTAPGAKISRSMWVADMEDKNWLENRKGLDAPVPKEFKAIAPVVVEAFKEAYPGYTVTLAEKAPAENDGVVVGVIVSGAYEHNDGKYSLGMSCNIYMRDLKTANTYMGIASEDMGYFKTEPVEIREANDLKSKNQTKQAADLVSSKIDPVKSTLPGLKIAAKKAVLEFLAKVKAAKAG